MHENSMFRVWKKWNEDARWDMTVAYRKDETPVCHRTPEVGGLGADRAVEEGLEHRRQANDFSKDSPHQLTESSEKETKALALSEPNMIKG